MNKPPTSGLPSIVLLEDDHDEVKRILDGLNHFIPNVSEIGTIKTFISESGILSALEEIASRPPLLIILDIMVRFVDDGCGKQHPDGRYRAGFRIAKSILNTPSLSDVPIIFHTNCELSDIRSDINALKQTLTKPPKITYVGKTTRSPVLFDEIRRILNI